MKNLKPIKVHAFLRAGKKVENIEDAKFVKFSTKDGFLTLRKDHIKNLELLPEII